MRRGTGRFRPREFSRSAEAKRGLWNGVAPVGTVWHERAREGCRKNLAMPEPSGVSRTSVDGDCAVYHRSYRDRMSVVKRSVSFDAELWDELVREVGSGPVSPLVNDALAHYLRRQRGLAAVADYQTEHGEFTEEELAEADRLLDAAGVVDLAESPPPPQRAARKKRAAKKPAARRRSA